MNEGLKSPIRIRFAGLSPDLRVKLADALAMGPPNESLRAAISLGMQKLALRAQRERFTGQGPFPVAQRRLGNVSGRLKRDLHAEPAVITARGYFSRIGAAVEYFGAHEVGFSGEVMVKSHTRRAYEVKRKARSGISKGGKTFSVRANQYSVLPTSVRAHARRMKVPARAPLRTAIEQHGEAILGDAITKALRKS